MQRILIGTGNRHKQQEILRLLGDLPVELVCPDDLSPVPTPPPETGATFEANAREKALAYARATGLWTLADDSGLCVDALGGEPGVRSARFSDPGATDERNNDLLLQRMAAVADGQRQAHYVAVIVLANPERALLEVRGECHGEILRERVGTGGFGYDPLFRVPELGKTFAQSTQDEKGAVSHRGKALLSLTSELEAMLEDTTAR